MSVDRAALGTAFKSNSFAALQAEDHAALAKIASDIADAGNIVIHIADIAGRVTEKTAARMLTANWETQIERLAYRALSIALDVAVRSLRAPADANETSGWLRTLTKPFRGDVAHQVVAGATGAASGFFGLTAIAIELPMTTTTIMRSIAEIGNGYGEDPAANDARQACLETFLLRGRTDDDDEVDLGYWLSRATLTGDTITKLLALVAKRFGVTIGQKALAQWAPVIGAAGGAAINIAFLKRYQQMAHCRFRLLPLERRYGSARNSTPALGS